MSVIFNNQRKIKIDVQSLGEFAREIGRNVPETKNRDFSVAFVSDRRMRELNKKFRNKNKTTDVLSFPSGGDQFEAGENYLGDIVISAEQAARQAQENDLSFELEIRQLILHGVLHLCGYDHETDSGEMNARELELREKLGIS
jgi:probable rRNA maturation factor